MVGNIDADGKNAKEGDSPSHRVWGLRFRVNGMREPPLGLLLKGGEGRMMKENR